MEQMHIICIDLLKLGVQLHGERENKEGKTPWDFAKANAALKRMKPYWRLNVSWFQ